MVCVDVAMRQPRVFGSDLTPTLSVTDAVDPPGVPPGPAPGRGNGGADEVHHPMDGGCANDFTFVFKDLFFRAFDGLPPLPETTVPVGLTPDSTDANMGTGAQPVALDRTPLNRHDKGAGLRMAAQPVDPPLILGQRRSEASARCDPVVRGPAPGS